MSEFAYLIPVFPLIAFAINILLGRFVKHKAAWISVATSLLSCAIALPIAAQVAFGHEIFAKTWNWVGLGGYELNFGYLIDPAAATLLFVVTVVGTLIQVYSMGYMHDDKRFSRFFAYVSLFMAAMLTVVIADNYVLFFIAWEIMGLCSYLLIGFWFEKNSAANACKKAFLTTRVGDVGFFLGIMTLYVSTHNLTFAGLHSSVEHAGNPALLPLAAFFIFCGTMGKSAQFPLHVWLPDAMEGPTPVSALIHAATMVAAGVYLIIRSFPLFESVPQIMSVVASIGTLTAFMAAFIALTATDIKKVLAYSTISQLGYMVAALGLGSLSAGTFHLMTHAFFKALLFMGAGSVIHGCGTQDIREMGGLYGKMKHTALTFIIASIAISGVPPFSGFWSKDEILLAAFDSGSLLIFWILVITAGMTSFYMFRLVFLTFFGTPRDTKIHAHESPAVMTGPLWALAAGAVVLGLPGSPLMGNWFQGFLEGGHHVAEHTVNWMVMGSSILAAVGGIVLAGAMYLKGLQAGEKMAQRFKPLYEASINKLWFDEIYATFIVGPWHAIGRALFRVDQEVVDGAVNGTGRGTVFLSAVQGWIDKYIVDGAVNFVGAVTRLCSAIFRHLQTGFVQNYMLIVFVGTLILIYFELK